jgi:hypothetical protein
MTYQQRLDKLVQEFDRKVSDLAEEIRTEVIVPACKKWRMDFISGNGTFFFSKGDKTYSGGYGLTDSSFGPKFEKEMVPIFELLNTEVTHNQVLGYYVGDVRFKRPIG